MPPSVTSTGRLRTLMRETIAAESRKVAALSANTDQAGATNRSSAPSAGPATWTMFSITPRIEFAAARSSSATICGVIAATAGSYGRASRAR